MTEATQQTPDVCPECGANPEEVKAFVEWSDCTIASLRTQLAAALERADLTAVDLREAMRLLTADDDNGGDFHTAMQLIGKHCGLCVPDLPAESIEIVEYLKRNPVTP